MENNLGIILQARMGSHRLPGKILMDIEGRPLLGHIVSRLERRAAGRLVIATSMLPQDDAVEAFCDTMQVDCFRGSEENVLERYVQCAKAYGFEHVIRMTGDNPFPDVEEMDCLIAFHLSRGLQFSENFSVLPLGVGMEILTKDALEESLINASLPKHFEHADEYVLDNLDSFRHGTCLPPESKRHPEIRLTVDTPEDYSCACYIVKHAGQDYITTETAIALRRQYDAETASLTGGG